MYLLNRYGRGSGLATEDGDDVFDVDDEEAVVAFEIDGDSVFGIEEDFVVAFEGEHGVGFDFGGNSDDAAGDGGDFDVVRQADTTLGFLLIFILADEDAFADGFDNFEVARWLVGLMVGFVFLVGHFSV